MKTDEEMTMFLKPEDLIQMGLFEETNEIFRAIKSKAKLPPYIRLSKKNVRFPAPEFYKWLKEQTITPKN